MPARATPAGIKEMLDHIVLLENDVFQSFWLVKSLSMIMIIH